MHVGEPAVLDIETLVGVDCVSGLETVFSSFNLSKIEASVTERNEDEQVRTPRSE